MEGPRGPRGRERCAPAGRCETPPPRCDAHERARVLVPSPAASARPDACPPAHTASMSTTRTSSRTSLHTAIAAHVQQLQQCQAPPEARRTTGPGGASGGAQEGGASALGRRQRTRQRAAPACPQRRPPRAAKAACCSDERRSSSEGKKGNPHFLVRSWGSWVRPASLRCMHCLRRTPEARQQRAES